VPNGIIGGLTPFACVDVVDQLAAFVDIESHFCYSLSLPLIICPAQSVNSYFCPLQNIFSYGNRALMAKPTTSELARITGISLPFASQVLSGARNPTYALAIRIYRLTGWKHDSIADFGKRTIDELEQAHPWQGAA